MDSSIPPVTAPPQIKSPPSTTVRGLLGRGALILKILAVLLFALILLVPLGLVRETLQERQSRYNEAVDSITAPWGGSQHIIGPILAVPFTYKVETEEWVVVPPKVINGAIISAGERFKEKKVNEYTHVAYFLPDQLNVQGTLDPSERKRAIYTAHVYSASLKITGKFDKPDFTFTGLTNVQPQWDRARVCFAISDLRGVRESLTLVWGKENIPMQPGDGFSSGSGLHAMLSEKGGIQSATDFSLSLTLNGSDAFALSPIARSTKMSLNSSWPDPSFCGTYLPVSRDVTDKGFEASWETSFYARSIPQQWTDISQKISTDELGAGSFGVRMLPAVSAYRIVERSIKYGILFIALVFTVFFLFEAVAGLRLNSLNYLLAGATLCVFFLGLLALSEFLSFGAAYAISGATATVMISLYCAHILQSWKRALIVSAMLGGVYAYLYFVLRMEDFSLIAGTAALFAVLGAVMYATRNLRGNSLEKTPAPASPPQPPPLAS